MVSSKRILYGLGMGLSATVVLICSNIVISLLRKVIPDKVRIPCYIVVIAGFVTVVQFLLQGYVPSLYKSLGLFIPLIVVNCIILGRAEAFANKHNIIDSAMDGIGFTVTLVCMGAIREILGTGAIFGVTILSDDWFTPVGIMNLAPGAFFVYGLLVAILNKATKGKALKKKSFSCGGCPMYNSCNSQEEGCELQTEPKMAQKGAEA